MLEWQVHERTGGHHRAWVRWTDRLLTPAIPPIIVGPIPSWGARTAIISLEQKNASVEGRVVSVGSGKSSAKI